MRVIVIGAGEVGQSIAANLANAHDVVVVERDGDLVDELTYSLDVLTVHGDGTDMDVLHEAGVERADMLIASTDVDETNIVACGAAKTAGDPFTVARVKRRDLLATWQNAEGAFGVDFMVCSDLLTAEAIFRVTGVPGAHDVDTFAGGIVRMAEFEITAESEIADQTVSDADRYSSLTFAAVFRDDEVVIPTGSTRFGIGDRVVVIGSPDSLREFSDAVAEPGDEGAEEVVIFGGGEIGYQTARLFEEHGFRPQLIERDQDRARDLAERLPRTTVLRSDATDAEFLMREHVDEADVVVAALDSDEKNLLVSLLADRIGVERTIAVVETAEYADLFETVGVDIAVNPRQETAEEIVRFTREGQTEKIAMLENDRAEVVEIEIGDGSTLADRPIQEAVGDLPDGVVVGAISRGGQLVTPRGDTVIQPGDHVILFVDTAVLDEVTDRI
ncbi:Trk system potassium transporter TrkA [Halomicrobium urmianum]|uniref:Trk system potassium transporter TrkA n=1 Tax=Halomicrobium urmianum TaxID=1586233 RepID=UPI001CDA3959|nr:Trk system potassium transporter TrkA [Halomicrobium urmianum]